MKIGIISGHGHGDSGCLNKDKKRQEQTETRRVARKVSEYLKQYCEVVLYDTNRNAFEDVQKGQLKIMKVDYLLEIHFNSFNKKAYGTEIYVTNSEKATTVEQTILSKLSAYFTNRGVKRTNFSVIYNYKKAGISSALLEVCFLDNQKDLSIYDKNFNDICKKIAEGIAEGFGLKKVSVVNPTLPKPDKTIIGTYQFNTTVKVRTQPDTEPKYDTGVCYYNKEKVNIEQILNGNMYTWGKYHTEKGTTRYVALKDNKKNKWYASKV